MSPPNPNRLFAIVPAAGHSRRMGRPKLTLPIGDRTVLERLLAALGSPRIEATVLVVRSDDELLAAAVDEAARTAGGRFEDRLVVVRPEVDPPDMRASVQHALAAVADRFAPRPHAGWLLVPADHPVLSGEVVDRLIAVWDATDAPILLPTHAGRRGHPTFFRWELAARVAALPAGAGLNRLVAELEPELVAEPVDDPAVVTDLDTPEDLERLRVRFAPQ